MEKAHLSLKVLARCDMSHFHSHSFGKNSTALGSHGHTGRESGRNRKLPPPCLTGSINFHMAGCHLCYTLGRSHRQEGASLVEIRTFQREGTAKVPKLVTKWSDSERERRQCVQTLVGDEGNVTRRSRIR